MTANPSTLTFPAALAKRVYDIDAVAATSIVGGDEADVWKVQDAFDAWWCVKTFHRLSLEKIQQRALLMDRLGREGFPFPPVRRTTQGELTASFDGCGTMVCGWLPGATADALSVDAGESAGSMLAKLHVALRSGEDVVQQASRKNWEIESPDLAISKCRTIQSRIEALAAPTSLDRQIYDAIDQRIAMLSPETVANIRDGLPNLARQAIHGDYSRPNLLFAEGRLVGILDPLGVTGYPVWELGRIAFEPLTVVSRPDWSNVASAIIRGYRGEVALTAQEAASVVKVTMLYYLFSFWGVEGRYQDDGAVTPTGHEAYWLNRQAVTHLLGQRIADVEAVIAS